MGLQMREGAERRTLETIEAPTTTAMSKTPMSPPWIVSAWPTVLWQAGANEPLHLVHLGTSVSSPRDRAVQLCGQTLWADAARERSAGVAWDWIELRHGVYAMADPLGLVTNLQLLDADGSALDERTAMLRLNLWVHSLPWQREVQRTLELEAA